MHVSTQFVYTEYMCVYVYVHTTKIFILSNIIRKEAIIHLWNLAYYLIFLQAQILFVSELLE